MRPTLTQVDKEGGGWMVSQLEKSALHISMEDAVAGLGIMHVFMLLKNTSCVYAFILF